jgi:hypothetical protein
LDTVSDLARWFVSSAAIPLLRRGQAVKSLLAIGTFLKEMTQIVEGAFVRSDQGVLLGDAGAKLSQFGCCVRVVHLIVAMLVYMCFCYRVDAK